jgi:hypothetical protein
MAQAEGLPQRVSSTSIARSDVADSAEIQMPGLEPAGRI